MPESSFPGTLCGGLWRGWRQNFINYWPTLLKNEKGKVEKASKTLKFIQKWEQKAQQEHQLAAWHLLPRPQSGPTQIYDYLHMETRKPLEGDSVTV